MEVQWFRRDKPAVLDALRRGQRPPMATTMASGPLDEGVARPIELGIFDALDEIPVARERDGIADPLLLPTPATLPSLPEAGPNSVARLWFQRPALVLHLGWAPAQIQSGDNRRHRHPEGGRLGRYPASRHLAPRVAARRGGGVVKGQKAGIAALFDRQFVRGWVNAIDGSELGDDFRPVCLVCASGPRPVIVAWRLLEGEASEKGREAVVGV